MSCFLSESCLMLFAIDGITFFVEHTFSLGSFFVDDLASMHFTTPPRRDALVQVTSKPRLI